jgi:nucleoside-diphosphate-sugar epimerase
LRGDGSETPGHQNVPRLVDLGHTRTMQVLVIGGTRFVGYLAVWRLLAAGHRVTLLNRGTLADPFGDRVERLVGDRRHDLARLLAGRDFDAAIDLAAYTADDGRGAVEALAGRVGHYLLVSSGQVYLVRAPRPTGAARESDYAGPLMARPDQPADQGEWDYGIGKRGAEDAVAAARRERGFPATCLRIPMVHGERDYYRRLESYLWRLLDGGPILLPDGGDQPTRHVYGASVAAVLTDYLLDPRLVGEDLNLAQHETATLAELVTLLGAELGVRPALVAIPRAELVARGLEPGRVSPLSSTWMSLVDPSRAEQELGFAHPPPERYLGRIVAAFFAAPPSDRPPGYADRAAELSLAAERMDGRI